VAREGGRETWREGERGRLEVPPQLGTCILTLLQPTHRCGMGIGCLLRHLGGTVEFGLQASKGREGGREGGESRLVQGIVYYTPPRGREAPPAWTARHSCSICCLAWCTCVKSLWTSSPLQQASPRCEMT